MKRLLTGLKAQFFDSNGDPLSSGTIDFHEAGTSTDKDTYSDYARTTANANPVVLDAAGRATIFLGDGAYDVIVKDSLGNTVYTLDDVTDDDDDVSLTGVVVPNGSLENWTAGSPDNWTTATFTGGTAAEDQTDRGDGLSSIKFTSPGGASNGGGTMTSTAFIPISDDKTYELAWLMKSSVADVHNRVTMLWYDENQSALGTPETNLFNDSATNPTTWTAKKVTFTPQTGAYYAKIKFYGCEDDDVTAGSTWYDGVDLREGTQATFLSSNSTVSTTSYSIVAGDNGTVILVDTSAAAGAVTITMLAPATAGDGFNVTIINQDGSFPVFINNSGATQIGALVDASDASLYYTDGTSDYVNYLQGKGRPVQVAVDTNSTETSTTSAIPGDDTVPLISEGADSGLSVTITPTSTSNLLKVQLACTLSAGSGVGFGAFAIFQDSTCVYANTFPSSSGPVSCTFYVAPAGVVAETWTVRFGVASGAGTVYFNRHTSGGSAADYFGSATFSTLIIEEIQS